MLSCIIGTEVRDGEGEEGIEVLLLKFGDELAKRGDERRLRLEFMEGGEKAGEREREREDRAGPREVVWFPALCFLSVFKV